MSASPRTDDIDNAQGNLPPSESTVQRLPSISTWRTDVSAKQATASPPAQTSGGGQGTTGNASNGNDPPTSTTPTPTNPPGQTVPSAQAPLTPADLAEWIAPVLTRAQNRRGVYHTRDVIYSIVLWSAIIVQGTLGIVTAALSNALDARPAQVASATLGATTAALSAFIAYIQNSGEPGTSRRCTQDLDDLIQSIEYFLEDYTRGAIQSSACYPKVESFRSQLASIEERWASPNSSPSTPSPIPSTAAFERPPSKRSRFCTSVRELVLPGGGHRRRKGGLRLPGGDQP